MSLVDDLIRESMSLKAAEKSTKELILTLQRQGDPVKETGAISAEQCFCLQSSQSIEKPANVFLAKIKSVAQKLLKLVWPVIDNSQSAKRIIKSAFWVCIFSASVMWVIAIYSFLSNEVIWGRYDVFVIIDGTIFWFLAWNLWDNSRVWSILGLVYGVYKLVEKSLSIYDLLDTFTIMYFCFFVFLMVHTIRCTIVYNKLNIQKENDAK